MVSACWGVRIVKRFLGLLALLALCGCVAPHKVQAQFIGYTSPQTTQQTLATNVACTGAAQTYTVNNLGQTQHYLNIGSVLNVTKFQAEIDGIDASGNVYRISDVLELNGLSFSTNHQGSVFAAGYFPKVQISVTCSPAGAPSSYSASYSGAWGTFNVGTGSYLIGQIDKVNFFGADPNVGQTDSFQTPFGNSSGTMYFKYSAAGNVGGTITVACNTNGIPQQTTPLNAQSLSNVSTVQSFLVPAQSCPFATVTYNTPAGFTGTIIAEYVFNVPGTNTGTATIGAVTQGTVPWVVSGTVTANQGTLNLSSTILSGQQAVTTGDVALATNTLTHGICVSAFSTNTASVFIGTTGVTTSTGLELAAKASTCLAVSNSNAVHVIAAAGGSSVSWVGN
jgi:hypothetical protein